MTSSYFSRRRSQTVAICAIPGTIVILGLHMWGIHGVPELLYWVAGSYVTFYLLNKAQIWKLFN